MNDQRGSALVETILLGLVLLVPLIWALGVLADLHRTALATTAAAREAGFDAAHASSQAEADRAVSDAVARAFDDQGLDPAEAQVQWTSAGFDRGGDIEVRITYPVTVAQAPLLGRISGPSILVRASHRARVDPFRSR